jgi:hypothetical protein
MSEKDMMRNWKRKPSIIHGLKYCPTIEPEYSDKEQRMFTRVGEGFGLPMCIESNIEPNIPLVHNGPSVRKVHTDLIRSLVLPSTKNILEIGINVYQEPLLSTTRAILEEKHCNCVYLGVDINDNSAINNPAQNIYTITIDSKFRHRIREYMLKLGMSTIDLLMIDGDHSIEMTINDWCFTEFLSPFGTVIMRDTNIHIGPKAVFDAIDETLFNKQLVNDKMINEKFPDYGIGTARRLF